MLQVKQDAQNSVDAERRTMLFSLNIEQYTCILRQEIILRYVQERVEAHL